MTPALDIKPKTASVETGVRDTAPIAEGLSDVLADTYRLTLKTHIYHWNVEGPLFFSLHNLTETQYQNMFAAADELAERIRALGHMTPTKIAGVLSESVVDDLEQMPSAGEMCSDLESDHMRLSHRLHALIQLAEARNDMVTGDLATERAAFHEKAAWMLRALSAS
ncbi:MAG: DNA starvation/stationary phase protection protein [Alphaproteobacteria bacterium MedPE-SWcel]|nr:MAG: DNA starvation/stationary phase protection protein [Alphaproteobacteria bacterium MedPE-SWcel]